MRSVLGVVGAVVGNRAIARLMLAYAVFIATQNAVWITMLVYAYSRGGGAGVAAAVAIAALVPAALVAPVAAVAADRRSAIGVLAGGYLLQVAGMLTTAAAIALDAAPVAYAGAIVASVAVASTRPAQTVLVPALVRTAEELTAATVLAGWLESVGVVVSSLVTGVLLARAGPGWVFAVAGLAGVVSVVLSVSVPGVRTLAVGGGAAGRSEPLAGFSALASHGSARLLVALLTAHWVVIGALDLIFVVLAVEVLGRGADWVGYLNSAYGVGGVVAGLAGLAFLGRRRLVPPLLGGVVVVGAALALTALSALHHAEHPADDLGRHRPLQQ